MRPSSARYLLLFPLFLLPHSADEKRHNRVIFWQDPYLSGLQCFEDGIEEEESRNWKVGVVQTFFSFRVYFKIYISFTRKNNLKDNSKSD